MRRVVLLLIIVFAVTGCDGDRGSARGEVPPDPMVVQADVRAIHQAIYGEELDVDALLELTHPVVIDSLGGREATKATLTETLTAVRRGLDVEAFEFPSDPVFVSGTDHQFAIVPTRTIIRSGAKRVESGNFQFGVRQKGLSQWKYLEGSRVTPELLAQLFPDFPSDKPLPETYRRPIEESRQP